jgi:archaellum component FlaG (FlaF/FlaG flagellin family)
MTNKEVSILIQGHYHYTEELTEQEIKTILSKINPTTTGVQLDIIVDKALAGKQRILLDSIDMSSSINLLEQLLTATSNNISK